ncbi:MAG: hypothetical protein V3V08_25260 [Nannocystaceae bacterium]
MIDAGRRYNQREVARVLNRLGELQPRTPNAPLTRNELQSVATEAGLDVSQLDTALATVDTDDKCRAHSLGLRLFVVARRELDGTLNQTKLESALGVINRSVGVIGQHQLSENELSWFGHHVTVSVTVTDARISIQIEERFRHTAQTRLALALGSGVPTVAAIGAIAGPAGWVLGLIPLGVYGLVRNRHRQHIYATESRLEQLATTLAQRLAA